MFTKKKRLFLVCAHTLRLVPCGRNGQGYDIQQPRKWFRMSVSVTAFVLQVVSATLAAMAVAPLSANAAFVGATISAAMGGFESMLQAQLEGLTLNDDGADMDVEPQVDSSATPPVQAAQLKPRAYASLREFIYGVEDSAHLGRRGGSTSMPDFVFFADMMAQVQRDSGDADVQWVLKGQENAWSDAIRSAPIA